MMTEPLSTTNYDRVLWLDSHVVLEARPIDQLPWNEFSTGSILLLICRQVQSEIDAKKRDGRLGERARAFNKLLDAFLETRSPVEVHAGPPKVDVALASNRQIDWSALDTLDRNDGDDRIVAQALNANVDDPSRLELFSHDLRPRDGAITHGLRALKLPDGWLLAPTPSPHERKMIEMREQLRLLSETQPRFEIEIVPVEDHPLRQLVVTEPSQEQIASAHKEILRDAGRRPTIERGILSDPFADTSHPIRWDSWAKRLLERDLPLMHVGLSRMFSQHILQIRVRNVSGIAAAQMSVEISSGNAVLHNGPFYVQVFGPTPPKQRSGFRDNFRNMPTLQGMLNRDPFAFSADEEGPGPLLRYVCADFRQGREHSIQIALEFGEQTGDGAQIEVKITCANMKGTARSQAIIPGNLQRIEFAELVNEKMPFLNETPPILDALRDIDHDEMRVYRNDGSRFED